MENKGMRELVSELKTKSLISVEQHDQLIKELIEPSEMKTVPSWEVVRTYFFESQREIFKIEPMNSANLCPTFYNVIRAINTNRVAFNHDISIQNRQERYRTVVKYIRQMIADFIGGDAENLALVRNTSEGNNQLSRGFNKWEGREVLIWDENHPTNKRAWEVRASATRGVKEFSLKGVNFENPNDIEVEKEIIKAIIDKITAKTALLTFTEVSNISGIRMPTSAIIKAVRAHEKAEYRRSKSEIHIHVDGAISWGALNLNLKEMDCDSFSSSSHKWLMGPFETGIFYMRKERAVNFDLSIYGYNGMIDFLDPIPSDASRFELLGQRDDANIFALGMTIQMHNHINGADKARTQTRIKELQGILRKELVDQVAAIPNVEVRFITPKSRRFSNGVTVFQIIKNGRVLAHDMLNANLYTFGDDRYAVAAVGKDFLRICPHIMNLPENIEKIVEKIARFVVRNTHDEVFDSSTEDLNWPDNPYYK